MDAFEEFVAQQLRDIPVPEKARTIHDVYEAFTEEQKEVVHYLVGSAMQAATEATLQGFEAVIEHIRRDKCE